MTTANTNHVDCYRCHGQKLVYWMTMNGMDSGICFRCGGTGIDPNPVRAQRKAVADAEAAARNQKKIEEIKARKAAEEAQAEIDNEIRWAKEAYASIVREIAKEEKAGNSDLATMYRDSLMPLVMERLEKAVALNYQD